MLVTGARGVLGTHVLAGLGSRAVPFDRRDGQELTDHAALRAAVAGRDAIVHLAALHPLIAPPDATAETYAKANVAPFERLIAAAQNAGVQRIVLASSTSVWRDSPDGEPARFVDEASAADATDGYALSKIRCEALLAESGVDGVVLRLARFARAEDPEDEVRKLYRAVDPRDAAAAVLLALEARAASLYAIAAPTPFQPEDAPLLGRDARAAIVARAGVDPAWAPARIGSVVVARRAELELGWRCEHPSTLLRGKTSPAKADRAQLDA